MEDRRRNAEGGDCHHQRRQTLPSSRPSHRHDLEFVTLDNPGYEAESLERLDSQEEEMREEIMEHVARSRRSRSLHLVHRQGRVQSESSSERPDVSPGLGRITGQEIIEEEGSRGGDMQEAEDISREDSTEGFTNLHGVRSRSVGSIAQARKQITYFHPDIITGNPE